jgi:hypothetical protein
MLTRSLRYQCVGSFLFAALSVTIANAQKGGPLDVRACFSDILVDTTVSKSDKNVRYALQQQWNRSMYEEAKRSNTLTAWIDGVTVEDTYAMANIKRVDEMYRIREDYSYSANAALYRASLNPQAKDIITKCLDVLAARRGLGLYWVPWVHNADPTLIDLEFRFQYHPTTTKLHIATKRIDNATVEDDKGSHPTKLFDWSAHNLHPIDYDVLMPYESRFVTLRRKKPGDFVTIQIETTPNLSVTPITIDGEPNPGECHPVMVAVNAMNQPLHVDINDLLIDEDKYLMKDANGRPIPEGNGAAFKISIPLTSQYPDGTDFTGAQITNVICERQGQPQDYMDWTYAPTCCLVRVSGVAEGLNGVCRGWWQNRGRHIKMSIEWQRLGVQCNSHEWAYTNGKWQ